MTAERRQHVRVEVSTTAVVLARHNEGVPLRIDSLSAGGARLVGPITVEVGERVQILFEVDGVPTEVVGEIVRVDKLDMANDHIAVRFVDIPAETGEAIKVLVERMLELEERKLRALVG